MPSFTTPYQLQGMPGHPLFARYRIPVGISVLKRNGHFEEVPYPWLGETAGLVEGVEWFGGGRTYEVSDEVAAALEADGFTVDYGE